MNLSEFVLNQEGQINDLKDEVISGISSLASKDDLLAVMRRAGILEGKTITKDELVRFMKGDNDEEE